MPFSRTPVEDPGRESAIINRCCGRTDAPQAIADEERKRAPMPVASVRPQADIGAFEFQPE
jgi:hypothetical protein